MSDRIVRMPEAQKRTGLSRSAIYAAMACGKFPRNVKLLGARASGWPESTIDAWVAQRKQSAS